jgi:hypothetical protein
VSITGTTSVGGSSASRSTGSMTNNVIFRIPRVRERCARKMKQ